MLRAMYLALVKSINVKHLLVSNIVGMGFDGAVTFSGKKTGWCSSKTKRLTHLTRIAINSPDQLTEDVIEVILEIWNRKPRRIFI